MIAEDPVQTIIDVLNAFDSAKGDGSQVHADVARKMKPAVISIVAAAHGFDVVGSGALLGLSLSRPKLKIAPRVSDGEEYLYLRVAFDESRVIYEATADMNGRTTRFPVKETAARPDVVRYCPAAP